MGKETSPINQFKNKLNKNRKAKINMNFKPGTIVKHKLTGQRMLVLSTEGLGATTIPQTRVRIEETELKEKFLDTAELKEWVDCPIHQWKPRWSGPNGPEYLKCNCND